jgi:hypothetical protein
MTVCKCEEMFSKTHPRRCIHLVDDNCEKMLPPDCSCYIGCEYVGCSDYEGNNHIDIKPEGE